MHILFCFLLQSTENLQFIVRHHIDVPNSGIPIHFSDIDECLPQELSANHSHYAHNCHYDANCTNTKGSFYCTCHVGYSGDGVTCLGRLKSCAIGKL